MARGVVLNSPVELILLLQRGFTIALSGYNARYFWLYFSCQRKRRVGLLTLVMINLAIGLEAWRSYSPPCWAAISESRRECRSPRRLYPWPWPPL